MVPIPPRPVGGGLLGGTPWGTQPSGEVWPLRAVRSRGRSACVCPQVPLGTKGLAHGSVSTHCRGTPMFLAQWTLVRHSLGKFSRGVPRVRSRGPGTWGGTTLPSAAPTKAVPTLRLQRGAQRVYPYNPPKGYHPNTRAAFSVSPEGRPQPPKQTRGVRPVSALLGGRGAHTPPPPPGLAQTQ